MAGQQGYTPWDPSQGSSGQAIPQGHGYPSYQQQGYQQPQGHQQQGYQHQGHQQQVYQHQGHQQQVYQHQGHQQQGQPRQGHREQQPAMTHQGHYFQQYPQGQDQAYYHDSRRPANNDFDGAEAGSFWGDEHYADDVNVHPQPSMSDVNRTAAFVADSQARLGGPSHQPRTKRGHRTTTRARIAEFENVYRSSSNRR